MRLKCWKPFDWSFKRCNLVLHNVINCSAFKYRFTQYCQVFSCDSLEVFEDREIVYQFEVLGRNLSLSGVENKPRRRVRVHDGLNVSGNAGQLDFQVDDVDEAHRGPNFRLLLLIIIIYYYYYYYYYFIYIFIIFKLLLLLLLLLLLKK